MSKKFLVTGSTGFVGANIVHALTARGEEVHVIVRSGSDLRRLDDVRDKLTVHTLELGDAAALGTAVQEVRPDAVFHLAAAATNQAAVPPIREVVEANVTGTINIADACAAAGCVLINTGSSSEYGEKDHVITEEDLPEPNNLYGVTKVAGTLYCEYLAKKKDLPFITLRLFSPYGHFEEPYRLVPSVVRAALHGEAFNAPSATIVRDFVFIEDVVDAYLKAFLNADSIRGQIFNIASGAERSIADVVQAVEEVTGIKIQATYGAMAVKQQEPKKWVGDISKAQRLLQWSPQNSLEDGIRKYIEWARKTGV